MKKKMKIASILTIILIATMESFADDTINENKKDNHFNKYVFETIAGIGFGVIGGFIGNISSQLIKSSEDITGFKNWDKNIIGYSIGYTIGNASGVNLAGKILGYKGNYWGSLGTCTIAMIPTAYTVYNNKKMNSGIGISIILCFPTIGSIIGNEVK
jgi:hypothetical protein